MTTESTPTPITMAVYAVLFMPALPRIGRERHRVAPPVVCDTGKCGMLVAPNEHVDIRE